MGICRDDGHPTPGLRRLFLGPRGDIVLRMDQPTDTRATCTKCGRSNDQDANFCQNCGAPIARRRDPPRCRLVVSERAVEELKRVRALHIRNERDVLRIDSESDGFSLSVGPPRDGDHPVGNEDTMLLHASAEAIRLLGERSMVIHCMAGHFIIYAEDGAPDMSR
jgi:ribosomal protein L37E